MNATPEVPTRSLNDGHSLPAIGFGTYKLRGDEGIEAIISALQLGYRLLDTALNYENEREVGEAIRQSGIPRDEVFVTTKVPGRHHGFDETLLSFEESRMNLGLDYVDLYLIHWPLPRLDKYVETFSAMLQLQEEGVIRSVGVSNFTDVHLRRVIDETGVTPAVNQIELHPRFPQGHMREFHARHDILTESWSPLARGNDLREEPAVLAIAEQHGVTASQVVLRWHLQLGAVPIPKSSSPERQRENLGLFGFELSHAEIASISSQESGRLWGGHPDTNEEF
jgi:2,5-diketo-D-gluconate reductase A